MALGGKVELTRTQDPNGDFAADSDLTFEPIDVLVAGDVETTETEMDLVANPLLQVVCPARCLVGIPAHPRQRLTQHKKVSRPAVRC
jgi:hypothetical protein